VLIIHEGRIVADGTPAQLQRDFQGGEALLVELRTAAPPLEKVLPVLRSVQGVTGAELLSHDGPTLRFSLAVAKGSDAREEVFRTTVREGWVLLEMHRRGTSLEDVFHKLTAG